MSNTHQLHFQILVESVKFMFNSKHTSYERQFYDHFYNSLGYVHFAIWLIAYLINRGEGLLSKLK